MRYSLEIKKFFYSQYFFGGLRTVLGITLPAVLFTVVFHNQDIGFLLATGAIGVSVVDMPGPLKYKHNEMLACSVIGFLSALATGIATANPVSLWLTLVPLTFVLSLMVVYGNKWPQISFATLFMMIVTVDQQFTPWQALVNAAWLLAGGLWYTYWSFFFSRWQSHRITRQAIADGIFAIADYVRARAVFFDADVDLDECYRELVAKQVSAIERLDAARDIVLRNLPRQSGESDMQRMTLFNLFINAVDLHESIVAAHTDYALVRDAFGQSDAMLFFADLIRKTALDLENVGLAVLDSHPMPERLPAKAELRAIEYEIEQMRKKGMPQTHPEAYSAIVAMYRRWWSMTQQIDRMLHNLHGSVDRPEAEMRINEALARFLSPRRFTPGQIFSNLTMASPGFRHALRVTLAVALGLLIGQWLPLTNAYWILLTSVIILKPGFSLTRQRNQQRIIGTVIGCAASVALVVLIKDPHVLLGVMFLCMLAAYSLLLFNYTAAVVFTSAYVLLLYHLLAPTSMRLIGERAIDTLIGGAVAVGVSYLFPYWEYRLMRPLVKGVIDATRQYLDAVKSFASQPLPFAASAPVPATQPARSPSSIAARATARASAAIAAMTGPGVKQPVNANTANTMVALSDALSGDASNGAHAPGLGSSSTPAASPCNPAPSSGDAALLEHAPALLPEPSSPEAAPLGATPALSAAIGAGASALDRDFRYRLARKNVHIAFANLGQAFQRMMREPKSQQKFVPELNDLLVQSHALASQITAAAPLLAALDGPEPDALQKAIAVVDENLRRASDGLGPADDYPEHLHETTQALDAMVLHAEKAPDRSPEMTQELELLSHQCKQMLAASYRVSKDAERIRLPDS